ncbi:MAG: pilus assembly protein PilP [Desulfatitalea sp.]|nr:pilus assembly protein PilP [Desulfatitalea sp.]
MTGFWIVLLIGVFACGEDPPPPAQQRPAVSQRIAVEPPPPSQAATAPEPLPVAETTLEAAPAEPPAALALAASSADTPAMDEQPAPSVTAVNEPLVQTDSADTTAQPLAEEIAAAEPSELIRESLQMASTYDPTGRFDPFEPLFKAQPDVREEETTSAQGRERRVPQTPLERVALSQLKVTAIIRATSGNRALVVDATGKGYVVTKGTYIGLNSGRVIEIDAGRIVVEEEIETLMGELKIQLAELKLQKPPGEL